MATVVEAQQPQNVDASPQQQSDTYCSTAAKGLSPSELLTSLGQDVIDHDTFRVYLTRRAADAEQVTFDDLESTLARPTSHPWPSCVRVYDLNGDADLEMDLMSLRLGAVAFSDACVCLLTNEDLSAAEASNSSSAAPSSLDELDVDPDTLALLEPCGATFIPNSAALTEVQLALSCRNRQRPSLVVILMPAQGEADPTSQDSTASSLRWTSGSHNANTDVWQMLPACLEARMLDQPSQGCPQQVVCVATYAPGLQQTVLVQTLSQCLKDALEPHRTSWGDFSSGSSAAGSLDLYSRHTLAQLVDVGPANPDALLELQQALSHGVQVAVLQGDSGTGKSATLQRFARHLAETAPHGKVLTFSFKPVARRVSFDEAVRLVSIQLSRFCGPDALSDIRETDCDVSIGATVAVVPAFAFEARERLCIFGVETMLFVQVVRYGVNVLIPHRNVHMEQDGRTCKARFNYACETLEARYAITVNQNDVLTVSKPCVRRRIFRVRSEQTGKEGWLPCHHTLQVVDQSRRTSLLLSRSASRSMSRPASQARDRAISTGSRSSSNASPSRSTPPSTESRQRSITSPTAFVTGPQRHRSDPPSSSSQPRSRAASRSLSSPVGRRTSAVPPLLHSPPSDAGTPTSPFGHRIKPGSHGPYERSTSPAECSHSSSPLARRRTKRSTSDASSHRDLVDRFAMLHVSSRKSSTSSSDGALPLPLSPLAPLRRSRSTEHHESLAASHSEDRAASKPASEQPAHHVPTNTDDDTPATVNIPSSAADEDPTTPLGDYDDCDLELLSSDGHNVHDLPQHNDEEDIDDEGSLISFSESAVSSTSTAEDVACGIGSIIAPLCRFAVTVTSTVIPIVDMTEGSKVFVRRDNVCAMTLAGLMTEAEASSSTSHAQGTFRQKRSHSAAPSDDSSSSTASSSAASPNREDKGKASNNGHKKSDTPTAAHSRRECRTCQVPYVLLARQGQDEQALAQGLEAENRPRLANASFQADASISGTDSSSARSAEQLLDAASDRAGAHSAAAHTNILTRLADHGVESGVATANGSHRSSVSDVSAGPGAAGPASLSTGGVQLCARLLQLQTEASFWSSPLMNDSNLVIEVDNGIIGSVMTCIGEFSSNRKASYGSFRSKLSPGKMLEVLDPVADVLVAVESLEHSIRALLPKSTLRPPQAIRAHPSTEAIVNTLFPTWMKLAATKLGNEPLTIVLDGLEHGGVDAVEHEQLNSLSWLPPLPSNVRVVATTSSNVTPSPRDRFRIIHTTDASTQSADKANQVMKDIMETNHVTGLDRHTLETLTAVALDAVGCIDTCACSISARSAYLREASDDSDDDDEQEDGGGHVQGDGALGQSGRSFPDDQDYPGVSSGSTSTNTDSTAIEPDCTTQAQSSTTTASCEVDLPSRASSITPTGQATVLKAGQGDDGCRSGRHVVVTSPRASDYYEPETLSGLAKSIATSLELSFDALVSDIVQTVGRDSHVSRLWLLACVCGFELREDDAVAMLMELDWRHILGLPQEGADAQVDEQEASIHDPLVQFCTVRDAAALFYEPRRCGRLIFRHPAILGLLTRELCYDVDVMQRLHSAVFDFLLPRLTRACSVQPARAAAYTYECVHQLRMLEGLRPEAVTNVQAARLHQVLSSPEVAQSTVHDFLEPIAMRHEVYSTYRTGLDRFSQLRRPRVYRDRRRQQPARQRVVQFADVPPL